jgi:hypothetical protein
MSENSKDLLEGLKDRSPKFPDSSTHIPTSPSVDQDATRTSTAPNPKAPGGRCA